MKEKYARIVFDSRMFTATRSHSCCIHNDKGLVKLQENLDCKFETCCLPCATLAGMVPRPDTVERRYHRDFLNVRVAFQG